MNFELDFRKLSKDDEFSIRKVYEDAVLSISLNQYTQDQINSWSALSWVPGVLDKTIKYGKGWGCFKDGELEAFSIRYPVSRLALIYCRGRSSREGIGSLLLQRIENDALNDKQILLETEASKISYGLFLKFGWKLKSYEKIKIGGIPFKRYLMQKYLINSFSPTS